MSKKRLFYPVKKCECCKKEYGQTYKSSLSYWEKRKYCSRKCYALSMLSNNNTNWKGNKVGYSALHGWINRRLSKPKVCSSCRKEGWLDIANISQEYKRDINDWEWLCRRCHVNKDGRVKNLIQGGWKPWYKKTDQRKEKHWNWKGGITLDMKLYQKKYYELHKQICGEKF